jgi:CBS domain-containing protein
MTPPRQPASGAASILEARSLLADQGAVVLAVVDEHGRFERVLSRDALADARDESATLLSLAPGELEPLTPEMTLEAALDHLTDYSVPWLPVVSDQHIVGGLGARDALREYHAAAARALPPPADAVA